MKRRVYMRRWHLSIFNQKPTQAVWNEENQLLAYQEETKPPRCPIPGLLAPWVLSTAGKLLRYLYGSYFLPDRNPSS